MKKIIPLLFIFLFVPLVNAISISPQTWDLTLKPGETLSENFTFTLSNETCSLNLEGKNWVYAPSKLQGTGNFTIPITVSVPSNAYPGTYLINLTYCDKTIKISLTVPEISSNTICPKYIFCPATAIAGKTITFDIRDASYNWVMNTTLMLTPEEGISQALQCPGFCSFKIPEEWKGSISVLAVASGCQSPPPPKTITLEKEGSLRVSVFPSKVGLGETFKIIVFDSTKGRPLGGVSTVIYGPTGSLEGRTNEYGVVETYPEGKVYGQDVKPDKIGKYQVTASYPGYEGGNASFEVYRLPCPYDCCTEGKYEAKSCQEGYKCVDNKCKPIQKPKLKLNCTPAVLFETSHCVVLNPNGSTFEKNFNVEVKLNGKTSTISFENGEGDISWEDKGSYKITVPDLDGFEGTSISGKVELPNTTISLTTILIFLGIIILLLIIFILWRKGKLKFKRKEKLHWETAPAESYPVEEEY